MCVRKSAAFTKVEGYIYLLSLSVITVPIPSWRERICARFFFALEHYILFTLKGWVECRCESLAAEGEGSAKKMKKVRFLEGNRVGEDRRKDCFKRRS